MANAGKGKSTGRGVVEGHPNAGASAPGTIDETDLSDEITGRNSLQGNDQENVRNQRHAVPTVGGAGGKPKERSKKGGPRD